MRRSPTKRTTSRNRQPPDEIGEAPAQAALDPNLDALCVALRRMAPTGTVEALPAPPPPVNDDSFAEALRRFCQG